MEIYSRSFKTLVDVMAESRREFSNYRDIIEISERIKHPEVKKESKDRTLEAHISRKSGNYTKAPTGAPFAKDSKASILGSQSISRILNVSSVTKRDTMLTNVRMKRRRMGKASLKSGS